MTRQKQFRKRYQIILKFRLRNEKEGQKEKKCPKKTTVCKLVRTNKLEKKYHKYAITLFSLETLRKVFRSDLVNGQTCNRYTVT